MSTTMYDQIQQEKISTMAEADAGTGATTTRSAFTHQTGQVLVTLGTLFKHVPPFNDTIDKSTSETLISLGKKLKATK